MPTKRVTVPPEITKWAKQYKGFLYSIVRADPALEYDDLLNDLHVLYLEHKNLSIKEIAKKYHMRKLGFSWVPEQPNSNWSDWENGGEEAADLALEDSGSENEDEPVGLLASPAQIANKFKLTPRRGQQIKKSQTALISSQVKGIPDEFGQLGLFSDGALNINRKPNNEHPTAF